MGQCCLERRCVIARFIVIETEYPDPDNDAEDAPLKMKKYFFSPLKVKYLEEFEGIINDIQKKDVENKKKMEEDPDFVVSPFSDISKLGDLLYRLVTVKHKNMTKDEFKETFDVTDYRDIMRKLAPEDLA